ncbi:hypothetical protein [Ferruginibacter sp.]|nr:hypothetical protein [Ferruginibacter sp.]
MKKIVRTVALANLILLYCFVISFYNDHGYSYNIAFAQQQQAQTESYHAVVAENLQHHIVPNETAFGAAQHVSPFSFKSQHIDFAGFAKGTNLVFLNTVTQYSRFTKTLVVNLNRAAIIFPFHYFW